MCKEYFESNGYRIGVNTPFQGTIVPLNFYGKDKDILSIMIEVNKRIYANEKDFIRLRECITSLLEKIEYNFY